MKAPRPIHPAAAQQFAVPLMAETSRLRNQSALIVLVVTSPPESQLGPELISDVREGPTSFGGDEDWAFERGVVEALSVEKRSKKKAVQ